MECAPFEVQDAAKKSQRNQSQHQVKWSRSELAIGACACIFYIITTHGIGMRVSARHQDEVKGLSKGWLGPFNDLSDHQWRNTRGSYLYFLYALSGHCSLGFLFSRFVSSKERYRIWYELVVGLAGGVLLHGYALIIVLGICTIFFLVGRLSFSRVQLVRKAVPLLSFALPITIFMAMHWDNGWQFASLSPSLAFMDRFRGLYRWNVCFNIMALKLISFNMDLYWSATHRPPARLKPDQDAHCYLNRMESNLPTSAYDPVAFLAYAFYVPLYVAGPTLTFNAWKSYMASPQTTYDWKYIVTYALRLLGAMFLMELLTHNVYSSALLRKEANNDIRNGLSPAELAAVAVCNMGFLFLKFLILWRFARLWSLLRGVDSPENMGFCIYTIAFSIQSFWRHWHKSFYVWIQRYAYIPLGGSKRKLYSIPIVFTFVAIWHEFSISLLAWGYLMVLSMIPEVLAHMWAKGVSTEMRSSRMWKLLICVGPAVNNMILILANLVGFSMGSSKSERSLATMYFTTAAIPFWLYTFIVISAKVPIVHTAREAQKDKENYMFGWYR
eukprot:GHVU01201216.1.p1 GENE.GHVU01201216.1~~GHVU01201216.1.p1  ORF type:complete len:555 (+),score=21.44 GHVU01201216.1:83-1747(+)